MSRFISIGQAAERLGVSISTLRRWEAQGKLVAERTTSGHRRYSIEQLARLGANSAQEVSCVPASRITIGYARVSSSDQKADLERQKEVLELYCSAHGWTHEVISDLGSGMNYRKKGLNRLLGLILSGKVGRLVITHKDRLLRFGSELVFSLCEEMNTEVVIINQGTETSFEEELAKDVLEIITVFSARLYGARSRKNQKLIEGMREAVDAISGSDDETALRTQDRARLQ